MGSKRIIYILLLCLILSGCKEKTFTITFNTDGGNVMESITLTSGENHINIEKPTKEGYLFVSWLKDGVEYNFDTPITEDITLTASWIEKPDIYNYYTVTFVVENLKEVTTVKEGETIKYLTPPTIDNYLFKGWYLNNQIYDFNTPVNENITLVAQYETSMVIVEYNLDGGLGLAMEPVKRYTTLNIPQTPTKEGYKFLKWTLDGKEFTFDTKITKDIVLKAEWEPIEYVTITFDTDGGNEIKPIKIEKNSKIKELPIPKKENYIFSHWQKNEEMFTEINEINSDITIKAIYKIQEEITIEEE